MCVHRESYICMCAYFPFGFADGIWYLIVLIPGHRLSFYSVDALGTIVCL